MQWRDFESACLDFLNATFSHTGATFTKRGASDSNESDILATTNNGEDFFIEVKKSEAQSGQFVVNSDGGKFTASPLNKGTLNPYSDQIIQQMNSSFSAYSNPGTGGIVVDLPLALMQNWIITHYKNKGVKFVISSTEQGSFLIFPVEKYGQYFNIFATYRVKRSGSSNPTQNNFSEIRPLINDPLASYYRIKDSGKMLVRSKKCRDKQRLAGDAYSYQLNLEKDDIFEIRRLSNTANANVIFTVKIVGQQLDEDLASFESELSL